MAFVPVPPHVFSKIICTLLNYTGNIPFRTGELWAEHMRKHWNPTTANETDEYYRRDGTPTRQSNIFYNENLMDRIFAAAMIDADVLAADYLKQANEYVKDPTANTVFTIRNGARGDVYDIVMTDGDQFAVVAVSKNFNDAYFRTYFKL